MLTPTRRMSGSAGLVMSWYATMPPMSQRSLDLLFTAVAALSGAAACLLTAAVLVGWWA